MKTKLNSILSLLMIFGLISLLFAPIAYAAQMIASPVLAAEPTTLIPVEAQNAVLGFFLKLAASHAWFATVLSFMALSRVWAKPVSSFIHTVIDLTPSKADDGMLNSVMLFFTANSIGKFLAYLIDWLTSIKIVPPAA